MSSTDNTNNFSSVGQDAAAHSTTTVTLNNAVTVAKPIQSQVQPAVMR